MLSASKDRFKSLKSAFRYLKKSDSADDGGLASSSLSAALDDPTAAAADHQLLPLSPRDSAREPVLLPDNIPRHADPSSHGGLQGSSSSASFLREQPSLGFSSTNTAEDAAPALASLSVSSSPSDNPASVLTPPAEPTPSGHTRRNSFSSVASMTTFGPENPLKILSQLEGGKGLDFVLHRAAQVNNSAKQLSEYMNRRAQAEAHFATDLNKYLNSILGNSPRDYKQGTYGTAAAAYLSCANATTEMHDDYAGRLRQLASELEEKRKKTKGQIEMWKERGRHHQKELTENMQALEKAKVRYDEAHEVLEGLLLELDQEIASEVASGLPGSSSVSGLQQREEKETLTRSRSLTFRPDKSLRKLCKDARVKADVALEVYKHQLAQTNTIRKVYFEKRLPRVLKFMTEEISLLDSALRYYLVASHRAFENMVEAAMANLQAEGGVGDALCGIDNSRDFADWAENEAARCTKYNNVEMELDLFRMRDDAAKLLLPRNVFGVSLNELVTRTERSVPLAVQKCIQCVEEFGLDSMGIYRISGSASQVKRLRELFDTDSRAVNLKDPAVFQDINNVAGVLKLFLRELPEPLLTKEFVAALSGEPNEGLLSESALVEACKLLPTENYALLSYMIAHLKKVITKEEVNKMSPKNLSIVFGPTMVGGDESLLAIGYRAVEGMLRGDIFRECEDA